MIRNVRVQNFKSLKNVHLEFGLRNVFVGPNMSGKSNIIDVLRLLSLMVSSPAGTSGLPNAVHKLGGFPELAWKGGDSNVIPISLDGDFPLKPESKEIGTWKYELSILGDSRGWIRVQDEVLAVTRNNVTYNLIDNTTRERVQKNADGRQFSAVTSADRSALEYETPDWDGNALREFIASWRFYRLFPPLMKQMNETLAPRFLTEYGENFSSWLMNLQTRYPKSFARIRSVSKDVFPEIEDLFTWPTQQATVYVASTEKHLKRPVGVWHMSDGQLVFIAFLSLIFGPSEFGAGFFCVEEPENHLHPRLLEIMVELLKQVQGDLLPEERAQILITTHSPHLVDKFELDELIVIEKQHGATILTRPSDKAHLRDLLKREEVGLGDLFYSGALGSA